MKIEIVRTGDGSHTLFVPELREHFHSIHGAVEESNHVFIEEGLLRCLPGPVIIFEVGFGTGLNVYLTLINSLKHNIKVVYHSIDNFMLPESIIEKLDYPSLPGMQTDDSGLFRKIHHVACNKPAILNESFELLKIQDDLITCELPGYYDLVYFDAFGPDKQPELWTKPVFWKIFNSMKPGGILVTYSAKGSVREQQVGPTM